MLFQQDKKGRMDGGGGSEIARLEGRWWTLGNAQKEARLTK